MSRERRADAAFAIAIFAGALFIAFLGPLDRRLEMVHDNDFSGIWAGPRLVLAGISPWDPGRYPSAAVAERTQVPDARVDSHLPWEVLALLPLGALPLEVAAWIWMLASMALATLTLRALLRAFLPARPFLHGALGFALFAGQPGFHAIVLGQWALLLMSALGAVVLALRAGHAHRAALAALAFLAKPQLFVWTALGLALPALFDARYRRFVRSALLFAGVIVLAAWIAFPDWFGAWLAEIPARRTGRSAVLFSALGEMLGPAGRIAAVALIAGALALASRFVPGSDAWLAAWLALSSAGAIYSWSYDQVLLFVPLVTACGVLVTAGRERAAAILGVGGASVLVLISPLFYALGVIRHDETFSIAVPVAFFLAIAFALWPYRRGAPAHRPAPQLSAA